MEQEWSLELRDSVSFITDSKPATFCSEGDSISPKAVYQKSSIAFRAKAVGSLLTGNISWASKTAKWVTVLATKPYDLSSVPRTYMAKGKNWLPKVTL